MFSVSVIVSEFSGIHQPLPSSLVSPRSPSATSTCAIAPLLSTLLRARMFSTRYLPAGSRFASVQAFRRQYSSSPAFRPRGNDGLIYDGHSYPFTWLRDACQCSSCLQPSTLQKLHRTSDVPLAAKPKEGGVDISDDGVHVTWDSDHRSHYPADFLKRYASREATHAFHRDVDKVEWDAKHIESAEDLFMPYEALATPSGLLSAITQLTRYGLLFVSAVPNERTSNEECELRKLGQRFGELRTTFYGETWDVKNVKNSRNIAYTNVKLGVHMDLL